MLTAPAGAISSSSALVGQKTVGGPAMWRPCSRKPGLKPRRSSLVYYSFASQWALIPAARMVLLRQEGREVVLISSADDYQGVMLGHSPSALSLLRVGGH